MRRAILVGLCLALTVAGCGTGDDITDDSPLTTAAPPTTAGTTTTAAPTTTTTLHPALLDEPLEGRIPFVVDGDGAPDDIKAILYLLQQPDVSLRAVTMSGTGVAHCPQGAENAKAVLELVGAGEVPVACGRRTPLRGFNAARDDWRLGADTLGGMTLPEAGPLSELTSPRLLAETIAASPDKVVLVALGPLTNLAEALQSDPAFLDNVEMIYLMGGAVDVAGNVLYANLDAEFNIWADPYAAALVFESGVPLTLVPLDATNDVPVTPRLWEVFDAYHDTPSSRFMHEYLTANPLTGALYHWDELAAVISTDESVARFEDRRLVVEHEGGRSAGRTVEDPNGTLVRVAMAADAARFEDRFYRALTGSNRIDVPAWRPDVLVEFDGETCTYHGPESLPERFSAQLDNNTTDPYGFAIGYFAPGTTSADLAAWLASGAETAPPFWTPVGDYFALPDAHDVWLVEGGGPDVTAVCYQDPQHLWLVAGPDLED